MTKNGKQINITLPESAHESLDDLGELLGVSKTALIRIAVFDLLIKYKEEINDKKR